jgi:hypothetical protein
MELASYHPSDAENFEVVSTVLGENLCTLAYVLCSCLRRNVSLGIATECVYTLCRLLFQA